MGRRIGLGETDYTFGHDEIAQRVVERDAQGAITSDETYVFGHDGHGSVRVLYDAAAAIAQAFTFAAYGQMLAVHDATATTVAVTDRLSSLGYSGEHFDAKAQQQYLRARFYNPANGRFNRLDPYAGNMQDPQSLHKYAYVHGDPITFTDPTGKFASLAVSVGIAITVPGASDFLANSYQNVLTAYAVNLLWDVEWASDLSRPDSDTSRSDNRWFYQAILAGIYDSFYVGIPLTSIGFNPLDFFQSGSELPEFTYDEWVSGEIRIEASQPGNTFLNNTIGGAPRRVTGVRAGLATFSQFVRATTRSGLKVRVPMYKSQRFSQSIALFPRTLSPHQLKGPFKARGFSSSTPEGKPWKQLSKKEKSEMRRKDVSAVEQELRRRGIEFTSRSSSSGKVQIDGVDYTIHHHHKKGYFQLVESTAHRQVRPQGNRI
ncbi:MAG: RHS repeat-associated core domain-containing protein [Planctomycetota bacterium]